MSNLNIFFNTKVEDSGLLSYVGNTGLAPVRYLFTGMTYQIKENEIHRVLSFTKNEKHSHTNYKLVSSQKTMYKTALSVILLVPGLFLFIFKLASYIFSDVRKDHQRVKESLIPIDRHIRTSIDPVKSEEELASAISIQRTFNPHRPTNALIIHANGHLKINREAGILGFKPKRLILEGATIVHEPCASTRLDDAMGRNGNWNTNICRVITSTSNGTLANEQQVSTVEDALKAPLERKGKWPFGKFFNGLFIVPRPDAVRA